MKKMFDGWLILLPDGRELTAKTTRAVEHHIRAGTIPRESRVRRSRDQDWTALKRSPEFKDILNGNEAAAKDGVVKKPGSSPEFSLPIGLAARLDPMRLRTLGVRGLWDDLIGALDSMFTRKKLGLTILASAVAGVVVALVLSVFARFIIGGTANSVLPVALGVMAALAIPLFAFLNGLLARIVHVELSYMRPAVWKEVLRGFGGAGFRLTGAYLFVLGGALLLLQGCRWTPGFAAELIRQQAGNAAAAESVQTVLTYVGILAEIAIWMIVGLSWLLPPVFVVENLGIFDGLRAWVQLLRQHLGRVIVGQGLALATGVLISLPFAVPVWLALRNYPIPENVGGDALRGMLVGAAAAPFLAFVAIANVFIYLDVKYEVEK